MKLDANKISKLANDIRDVRRTIGCYPELTSESEIRRVIWKLLEWEREFFPVESDSQEKLPLNECNEGFI